MLPFALFCRVHRPKHLDGAPERESASVLPTVSSSLGGLR